MAEVRSVEIVEVGPRDGLQNEPRQLSTAAKAVYVERAFAAGATRVEITSFVHPRAVPAMADAERVAAAVHGGPGRVRSALVVNGRGLDRALAAGVDELNAVLVASETFSQRNQRMSVDQTLAEIGAMAAGAAAAGVPLGVTVACAFGCPFEGPVAEERVLDLAERAAAHGVGEVSLADTIGVGTPDRVERLVAGVAERLPGVRRRAHFHNTRNTGYANAVAAVAAGIDALDAATGGIGGCPFAPAATGNIATEDLAYLLHGMGVSTGLDLPALVDNAVWLQGELGGGPVPGQLSRAGLWP
ncbi:hydroxymethylglutaryl-CoA lyase [Nocardioides sp. GY 10113]|uniref:hydroxymethylglutaryl-CoA lyase n=1 Tax=Nocardioides sp. GY 10113 TaxID=2569761 RepID=UPI0010A87E18|nr:hydroxymethylglutaryl-CoA lyase [Nocardioides sp. GY 10113]TIC86792.1 hydroxymethylglutaryl-CoA lyase [Nocardioides sp. GY 10113]